MIYLSSEERALRKLMAISGVVYLVAGSSFAAAPGKILSAINALSAAIAPRLPPAPISGERFWVSLAFSMMMTIAFLSFLAAYNVRRYRVFVVPVLVAKASSAVSALAYFALATPHLASLAIVLVDGSIFGITLFFFLRASLALFRSQTALVRDERREAERSGPAVVASIRGEDKLECLDRVLSETGFFELLEGAFRASGKARDGFSVVVKPNFMFMHSRKDPSTYTDPALVEGLIDRIAAKGFSRIAVVEAQSTYGNYYRNREVLKVAEYVGYARNRNYRIVDLTEEMVPFDYGGRLGWHFVGPTWRDADFRISFAKNKTHVFCHYTLTLKNLFGTLPMQDKLKEYHSKREYDWPTIEALRHFPVHYGLIDAFLSADGQFGVISDPSPRETKTIIGGDNLIAVDWVGAKKMGLNPDDPEVGRFLPLAVRAFGQPDIRWIGDTSTYPSWTNVNEVFIRSLDVVEEAYAFSNWWFSGLTAMDPYFAFKPRAWPILLMRKALAPFKRLLYPHDHL